MIDFKKIFSRKTPFVLAFLVSVFFISCPSLAKWIATHPAFRNSTNAALDIAQSIQYGMIFPFGKWLGSPWKYIIVFPYWYLVFSLVFEFVSRTRKFWKWFFIIAFLLHGILFVFPDTLLLFENNKPSTSKGSVSRGSVADAKRVPMRGKNYTTYSFWGYLFNRTYAHDKVKQTILNAYETCETSCPNTRFLLGEIGFPNGGKFLPHRTHRNGMSVDFMSPLKKGEKYLGTGYHRYNFLNLWGYAFEFDEDGKDGKREMDFETMALHLQALDKSAKNNGLYIQKVILHPDLRNKLLQTKEGKRIKHLPFTKNPVILRHDDHYHVDFGARR